MFSGSFDLMPTTPKTANVDRRWTFRMAAGKSEVSMTNVPSEIETRSLFWGVVRLNALIARICRQWKDLMADDELEVSFFNIQSDCIAAVLWRMTNWRSVFLIYKVIASQRFYLIYLHYHFQCTQYRNVSTAVGSAFPSSLGREINNFRFVGGHL
jgi:hypothetical protein